MSKLAHQCNEYDEYDGKITRLIHEMQSILKPFGTGRETIADAVEQSLAEINRDGCSIDPWLLTLVFWKIFDSRGFLLINHKTQAGNEISLDIITAAYAIWNEARQKAFDCGLDELDAEQALIRVVHALADSRSRGKNAQIHNLCRYIFAGYIKELKRAVKKMGVVPPPDSNGNEPVSDDGAFFVVINNDIACAKIMSGLTAKEDEAVTIHCIMGCGLEETAEALGISYSAVRQVLCRAFRKMRKATGKNKASGYREMTRTGKNHS
jgi:DNA-directed RNA polymerase specialized sigma24 family protein